MPKAPCLLTVPKAWTGRTNLTVPCGMSACKACVCRWKTVQAASPPRLAAAVRAQSLESRFAQSLLAARQQHLHCRVETRLDFDPVDYHHTAGLVYYYDNNSHYYLALTRDERQGKVLTVMRRRLKQFDMPIGAGVPVPDGPLTLQLETKRCNSTILLVCGRREFCSHWPRTGCNAAFGRCAGTHSARKPLYGCVCRHLLPRPDRPEATSGF